jgi:hypothetical protein
VGHVSLEYFVPPMVNSQHGCRHSVGSVSSSEFSHSGLARSSAALSSPRQTIRHRWRLLVRRESCFSGWHGGCSVAQPYNPSLPSERTQHSSKGKFSKLVHTPERTIQFLCECLQFDCWLVFRITSRAVATSRSEALRNPFVNPAPNVASTGESAVLSGSSRSTMVTKRRV